MKKRRSSKQKTEIKESTKEQELKAKAEEAKALEIQHVRRFEGKDAPPIEPLETPKKITKKEELPKVVEPVKPEIPTSTKRVVISPPKTAAVKRKSRKHLMTAPPKIEEDNSKSGNKRLLYTPMHPASHYAKWQGRKLLEFNPPIVKFNEWEIGGSYQVSVTIQNVSPTSRKIGLLAPEQKTFSIQNLQFPMEPGFVAGGMYFSFVVHFAPKSLDMVSGTVMVRTEDEVFPLQILAKRDPPDLSIPLTLNCGYCLIEETEVLQLQCQNKGGPCKCKIKLSEESVGIFKIIPDEFALHRGDKIELKITFSPKSSDVYRHSYILVFEDFEQRMELFGIGSVPSFGVSAIGDTNLSEIIPTSYLQFKEGLTPNSSEQRKITVSNLSHVPFEFHWEIYPGDNKEDSEEILLPLGEKSFFSVSPSGGIFPPDAEVTFCLDFNPKILGNFLNVARLVVENVPISSPSVLHRKGIPSYVLGKEENQIHLHVIELVMEASAVKFDIVAIPSAVLFPGSMMIFENRSDFPTAFRWELMEGSFVDIVPQEGRLLSQESTKFVLTVQCSVPGPFEEVLFCSVDHSDKIPILIQGYVQPPTLDMDTSFIDFGLIKCGNERSQVIRLTNKSLSTVNWHFQEIPISTHQSLRWRKRRRRVKKKEREIKKVVSNRHEENILVCDPPSGTLEFGRTLDVKVTLMAKATQMFRTNLQCWFSDLAGPLLSVEGIIEQPKIRFSHLAFDLGATFMGVSVQQKVTMSNRGSLPVIFNWNNIATKDHSLQLEPNQGNLLPNDQVDITFSFTPHSPGLCEIVAICNISEPSADNQTISQVGFSLSTRVEGITVSHSVPVPLSLLQRMNDQRFLIIEPQKPARYSLDFGLDVPIFAPQTLRFFLRNNSSKTITFSLSVDRFGPSNYMDSTSSKSSTLNPSSPGKKLLLSSVSKKADKTETLKKKHKHIQQLLDGNGIAFVLSVNEQPFTVGTLEAFGKTAIDITCYSNMCGSFEDKLNYEAVVKGNPLNLVSTSFGINLKSDIPSIRWGQSISGGALEKTNQRILKILNGSPADIRIKWKIMRWETDSKMVDLSFQVEEGRLKLVLKHHERQSSPEFTIQPQELVIPALKKGEFTLAFHTPNTGSFVSELIGESEVIHEHKRKSQLRFTGWALPLTRVQLFGEAIKLQSSHQRLHLRQPALSSVANPPNPTQTIVLTNGQLGIVSFLAQTTPSSVFKISSVTSEGKSLQKGLNVQQATYELASGESLEMGITFQSPPRSIESIESDVITKGDLSLLFPNGETQVLFLPLSLISKVFPLEGIVFHPKLEISTAELDFETVTVGISKTQSFTLTNDTTINILWEIVHIPAGPSLTGQTLRPPSRGQASKALMIDDSQVFDVPSVFSLQISSGVLHTVNQKDQRRSIQIEVTFKPDHPVKYKSNFKILSGHSKMAEISFRGSATRTLESVS